MALAVGGGMVRGGNNRVWGEGVTRAELQKRRDGGDSLLATVDSSIRQQYRTTFCALKQTRSSYKPTFHLDSGLPFDVSSEAHGEGKLGSGLVAGGGRVRMIWTHI